MSEPSIEGMALMTIPSEAQIKAAAAEIDAIYFYPGLNTWEQAKRAARAALIAAAVSGGQ